MFTFLKMMGSCHFIQKLHVMCILGWSCVLTRNTFTRLMRSCIYIYDWLVETKVSFMALAPQTIFFVVPQHVGAVELQRCIQEGVTLARDTEGVARERRKCVCRDTLVSYNRNIITSSEIQLVTPLHCFLKPPPPATHIGVPPLLHTAKSISLYTCVWNTWCIEKKNHESQTDFLSACSSETDISYSGPPAPLTGAPLCSIQFPAGPVSVRLPPHALLRGQLQHRPTTMAVRDAASLLAGLVVLLHTWGGEWPRNVILDPDNWRVCAWGSVACCCANYHLLKHQTQNRCA